MKSPRRPNDASHARPNGRESGFSLIELIIAMAVMAEVLVVVLILFDVNNKVTRVQTNVADMQQSHRIAQYDVVRNGRMAGRGGMPQGIFPNASLAVVVDQNVPANTQIGDGSSPDVVEETDILTLRGALSMPVYQVRSEDTTTLTLNVGSKTGRLIIDSRSPANIKQPFDDLKDIDNGGGNTGPEAMILVSPTDDALFAVVEITKVNFVAMDVNNDGSTDADEERATIDFTWNGTYATEYLSFTSGAFPAGLTSVAFAGLLEEYRYYVREDYAIAGDAQSDLMPRLSRARFYPGTDVAYDNDAANLSVDIADSIMDLQVTLGLDRDGNGVIDENVADTTDDDWLYNDSGDDDTDLRWGTARLFYVGVASLARTARPDTSYRSERILTIENRDYNEPIEPVTQADKLDRMHRRRQLRTVVDLRNLG